MGNILNIFKRGKEYRLLMQGLDAAGKTTILYKLKLGEVVKAIPTIGFNVESLDFKNLKFTVWDAGSRDKMRPLIRHYYPGTQGLIFVIDSNDRERINEAKYEMHTTLNEDELRDTKVLIVANKQDLQNVMSVAEITEQLELHKVKHQCNVFATCATTGDGLNEALGWLADVLDSKDSSQVEEINLNNEERGNVGYFQKGLEAIKKLFTS